MKNIIYAELRGQLWEDVLIKRAACGREYGVLYLWLRRRVIFHNYTPTIPYDIQLYKAIVWDSGLLEKHKTSLKNGTYVELQGELRVIGGYTTGTSSHSKLVLVIGNNNSGISILSNDNEMVEEEGFDPIPDDILQEMMSSKDFLTC